MAANGNNLEDIYWSQFRVVQFIQRVSASPRDGLVLPKTFSKNLRDKLEGNVVLKTPSDSKWIIEVKKSGGPENVLILKGGWREFAQAHDLEKDDTLVFKYHGNSEFDVTMFDGKTACEKVCSYFVRKKINVINVESPVKVKDCVSERIMEKNKCLDDDCQYISSLKKESTTTNGSISGRTARKRLDKDYSEEDGNFVSSKKRKRASTSKTARAGAVISGVLARRLLGTKLCEGGSSDDLSDIGGRSNIAEENGENFNNNAVELARKRKVASESEIKRTLERAQKGANGPNVLLVSMSPSYVNSRPCLTFSARWARDHGLTEKQDVELHVEGNTKKYVVRFYYRECSAGMTKGWKLFVIENELEEGDVCLFDVIPDSHDPVHINVRIFRVADDMDQEEAY